MSRDLLDTMIAFLAVASAGGMLCAAVWIFGAGRSRSLSPPLEGGAGVIAEWSAIEVILAFFLYFACQSLVSSALAKEPPSLLAERADLLKKAWSVFWIATISTPLAVAAILLALHFLRGIRPAQVGFSGNRIGANLVFAYVIWLVVTPLDLTMFDVIARLVPVQPHPFETLAKYGGEPLDWTLLLLSAVVMAPLVEELLFRGVLLRWLMRTDAEGHLGLIVLALVLVTPWSMILDAIIPQPNRPTPFSHFGEKNVPTWAGALFVAALLPGYAWLLFKTRRARQEDRPQTAEGLNALAAIYGSAMLFAVFHMSAWPSPIPLFFLGLGLGWAAHRSGNLVAPIVVHALFNAVACAQVVMGAARNAG